MDVNFDLQRFLADMRTEMQDGFDRLDKTANQVRTDLVAHELSDMQIATEMKGRIDNLNRLHDNVRWMVRTIMAAIIVTAVGLLFAAWR